MHQVWVGDEEAAEGDEIAFVRGEIGIGTRRVIAAGEDVFTVGGRAQLRLESLAHRRRTHGAVVDHVEIDQADIVERLDQAQIQRIDVSVRRHAVEHAVG